MNTYFLIVHDINGGDGKMQKIECNVYDCKYCNVMKDLCRLKKIKVKCCRSLDDDEATMCANYVKASFK